MATVAEAIEDALILAALGDSIITIIKTGAEYGCTSVPVLADSLEVQQVALVTPDGQVWRPESKC